MIWDKLAVFYDFFESLANGKVNRSLAESMETYIEKDDVVLECACGTGMLSVPIAKKCKKLTATDYSNGMLKQAKKKLRKYSNVEFAQVNIMNLPYENESFDAVSAANVIHLLDNPDEAIKELMRVCRTGGRIIIPTYVNAEKKEAVFMAKALEKLNIDFKREFDRESYKAFFEDLGYQAEYRFIAGRMPAMIAVIKKQ